MNETAVKLMMWGSINSDMFQAYAHLTGSDVDKAVLELHGIMQKKTKERDHSLDARECPHCHAIAGPTQKFCGLCATPLTDEAAKGVALEKMAIKAAGTEYVRIDDVAAIVKREVEAALNGKR